MIAVMLILGVLGVSVIAFTHTSEHSHLSANAGSRAYYLAESGLRYAQEIFCNEGWLHGRERTLRLQGGEQVEVVRIAQNFVATGTANPGTALQARARVQMPLSLCGVDPEAEPVDEFAIFGEIGVALGRRTVIEGDVAITEGDIDIQGDVNGSVLAEDVTMTGGGTVDGDIYSSGQVDVTRGTVTGDIHSATGIIVQSAESVVEGWLFSQGDIEVSGGGTVSGHIYSCGGDVTVRGTGNVTAVGSVAEPIEIRASGDVYLFGSALVYGDVHAGGSIYMTGSARIEGNAYAKVAIIRDGSSTITGMQYAPTNPEAPICPDLTDLDDLELPEPTEFTAGGTNISVPAGTSSSPTHYYLPPGTYGSLALPNNSSGYTRLYLEAGAADHGNYYFTSVNFGSQTTLYLNLSGTYDIRVFVVGNVAIGSQMNVFVSLDGTTYYPMTDPNIAPEVAARVYWESHGDYNLQTNSHWFGSVYTPEGSLAVGNTSYLIGSFYSGGGHNIVGSTVVHVAPNYFKEE